MLATGIPTVRPAGTSTRGYRLPDSGLAMAGSEADISPRCLAIKIFNLLRLLDEEGG